MNWYIIKGKRQINLLAADHDDAAALAASADAEFGVGPYHIGERPTVWVTMTMLNGSLECDVKNISRLDSESWGFWLARALGAVAWGAVGDVQRPIEGAPSGITWEIDGKKYRSRCAPDDAGRLSCWLAIAGLYEATIAGATPMVWTVEWRSHGITGRIVAPAHAATETLTEWVCRCVRGARVDVRLIQLCDLR